MPAREIEAGRLYLSGDAMLTRTMDRWLKTGDYGHLDGIEQLDMPTASAAA